MHGASRLNVLILTLILKRNEGGFIVARPLPAEDVKLLLPHLVAVIVKCLQRSAEVIRHDWHDNETDFGSVEDRWGILSLHPLNAWMLFVYSFNERTEVMH